MYSEELLDKERLVEPPPNGIVNEITEVEELGVRWG